MDETGIAKDVEVFRCAFSGQVDLVTAWGMCLPAEPKIAMKIVRKNARGESRELLLKEYFLNAYLIAVLKRVGDEVARHRRVDPLPDAGWVRVRHDV